MTQFLLLSILNISNFNGFKSLFCIDKLALPRDAKLGIEGTLYLATISSNFQYSVPLITDLQKVTSRSFDRFRARSTQAAPQPVEKLDQSV